MKRVHNPFLHLYCDSDNPPDEKSGMKDIKLGLVDFERFEYDTTDQLNAAMNAVVVDWKNGHQRHHSLGGPATNGARYDVATCKPASRKQRGVVAIYMSGWEAWKWNLSTLLGR